MLVILIVASIMYLDVQATSSRVTFLYQKECLSSKFTLLNGFADLKTSPLEELQIVFTQKLDIAK